MSVLSWVVVKIIIWFWILCCPSTLSWLRFVTVAHNLLKWIRFVHWLKAFSSLWCSSHHPSNLLLVLSHYTGNYLFYFYDRSLCGKYSIHKVEYYCKHHKKTSTSKKINLTPTMGKVQSNIPLFLWVIIYPPSFNSQIVSIKSARLFNFTAKKDLQATCKEAQQLQKFCFNSILTMILIWHDYLFFS